MNAVIDTPANSLAIADSAIVNAAIVNLAKRIDARRANENITLIGVDGARILQALKREGALSRSALLLALSGVSPVHILERILDDLAQVALALWPDWPNRHEPRGPQAGIARETATTNGWRRFAPKLAAAGRPPRFRTIPNAIEFFELAQAINRNGVTLIGDIDPVRENCARAQIDALEWCAARGASVICASSIEPPRRSPWDRILHAAIRFEAASESVLARYAPPASRAHPASAIERRVEAALRNDPELAPLFASNVLIPIPGYGSPRVDLYWPAGEVVVELDGPEHQETPKFDEDRHRDYELLASGRLVLRITNAQVETDLQRAIEKIRAIVRLRKSS